jgi:hypothetical protein
MEEQVALVEPKRFMLKRSPSRGSCSLTEDETTSSTVTDREDIQLITRPKRSSLASPILLNFESEIQEAINNPKQVTLSLTNFIERSTRHDVYALRDLLLRGDRKWESVSFNDVCYATSFRRWAYKKENIHHHIQKLCVGKAIPIDFHAQMEINVDDMSSTAALSLLAEVKKHPEVRGLTIVGHLNHEQEESLLKNVTSLVRLQDRDWDALNVYTGFSGGDEKDYEQWRQTILHYMEVFSELYTKYNAPIDIRPCANN